MNHRAPPSEADAVIIGGGIVGCSAAYYLARRGLSTLLFEKDEIGRAQSGRNWGFVRQQGRDPAELPMMMESNRIWRSLETELGADIEWVAGGNLALATTDEKMSLFEDWSRAAHEHRLSTQILRLDEIKALIPGMRGDWIGGMYTAGDGHAEPRKTTLAFGSAARSAGAHLIERCAVEGIDVENGTVSHVTTQHGKVRTAFVIVAAGAWSAKLVRPLGLRLPQRWIRSSVARTNVIQKLTDVGVWAPGVAFRQRRDGTLNLGGGGWADHDITLDSLRDIRMFVGNYWKNRRAFKFHVGKPLFQDALARLPGSRERRQPFSATWPMEPVPNARKVQRMIGEFRKLFPALSDLRVTDSWAGYIDATPDAVPVIGPVASPKGLIFGTGFSGHGFGLGPIAGRLIAETVIDGSPSLDIHRFRFSRFAEGAIGEPRSAL